MVARPQVREPDLVRAAAGARFLPFFVWMGCGGSGVAALDVGAPFFDEAAHVVGEGRVEGEALAGEGVVEAEGFGVERLAGAGVEAVLDELPVFGEGGAFEDFVAAVVFVVEEGVADVFEVGADLVCAPGFEDAFDDVDVSEAFEYAPVGDGWFAVASVGEACHDFAVGEAAPDVAGDGACFAFEVAPADGDVAPGGGLVEELGGEVVFGFLGLGDDEEARGVLVYAVDEPGAGVGGVEEGVAAEVPGEGVDEGAGVVPVGGVDDHAGGFVDDEQGFVLIYDVEGNVLGDDFDFAAGVCHHDGDDVAGLYLVAGFDGVAVDPDVPGVGGFLYFCAGGVGEAGHEELVHAEEVLSVFRFDAVVFVHFRFGAVVFFVEELFVVVGVLRHGCGRVVSVSCRRSESAVVAFSSSRVM